MKDVYKYHFANKHGIAESKVEQHPEYLPYIRYLGEYDALKACIEQHEQGEM